MRRYIALKKAENKMRNEARQLREVQAVFHIGKALSVSTPPLQQAAFISVCVVYQAGFIKERICN